jgi:hypothetical protein
VTRLRAFDADLRFKARSIISRDLPLDNMVVHLKLKDGMLVLAPLDFGVAGGHVTSQVRLDARQNAIRTTVEATASNLEAKALLPALKRSPGSAGKVGGRAKLAATGNSIAAMAGSANVAAPHHCRRARQHCPRPGQSDLANAAPSLGIPTLQCTAVWSPGECRTSADSQTFVIDSSEEKITGEGTIDFKNEAL